MTEIQQYAVRIHGGPNGSGSGTRASIHLFDKAMKMVGYIDFMDEGHALKPDSNEGRIFMNMPIQSLSSVVDLLRNEKPIYLAWQPTLGNAYLGTSHEPVGEGE